MDFAVETNNKELSIAIAVQTSSPEKIRITVKDYDRRKTYFTDRFKVVNGVVEFLVMMPISPKKVLVSVYNENTGNLTGPGKEYADPTFKVVYCKKKPLNKRLSAFDSRNPTIRSFVSFAERFAFNAGYLATEKTYVSDDGVFRIEFLDKIIDNGKEASTPARIHNITGTIQIQKSVTDTYTVPMIMAILLHEFSHNYINVNQNDESEADLNGLLIYLSLGYPRIEAHEAWINVFMGAQSKENIERYELIEKFIKDFENNKI